MLEALRRSFTAPESEINTRIEERARVLQKNSLDWAKEVIALLPQDYRLESSEVEILTLFLAERANRAYAQNVEKGWLTSLGREWNRKASEAVQEKFEQDIEEKIKECCKLNYLSFDSCVWVDWRASLRSIAQNLALSYDKLNINIFTRKPPKEQSQQFARLALDLADRVVIERNYMFLPTSSQKSFAFQP